MPARKLLWLLPLLILSACSEAGLDAELRSTSTPASEIATDTSTGMSIAADATNKERKLIRTADIECQVPNVLSAVTQLEKNVIATGGTIEQSNIDNNAAFPKEVEYKPDSLRRVQVCHTTATLTLRVPAHMLDSVVNSIPGGDSYVTSRRLTQQDVTFKYMTNALMNKPGELGATTKALQLAEDTRDAIEVQRYADARKEQFVNRHIENLKMLDNVTFSTLTVRFTQPETVFVQTIVNTQYAAKASFGAKLGMALHNGATFFQGFIIALVTVWPLLFIIGIALGIVFYVRKHKRVANSTIRQFDNSAM